MSVLFLVLAAGGFGGFYVGGLWSPQKDLSSRLEQVRGIQLPDGLMAQGGGGYGFTETWIIGGFGFGASRRISGPDLVVDYSVGQGYFEVGRLFRTGPVRLGVMALLGGGGASVTLYPRLTDPTTDELLQDPGRSATLRAGGFSGGVGLVAFTPLTSWLLLGVHAFGAYTLDTIWDLEEGRLLDAPAFQPAVGGIQVFLAMGGEEVGED